MVSIQALALCIGIPSQFSVLSDFFGFRRGRVPPDPTGVVASVSLLEQAKRLQQPHFHLNILEVGSDQFGNSATSQIDYAVYKIRSIYAQVDVGVGRVEHYDILTADAAGFDQVTSQGEMVNLSNRWRVNNDAIDVFIPANLSVPGAIGRSPMPGPCPGKRNGGGAMNGSVVGPLNGDQMARTFSHEIGHYFGLDHRNAEPTNLMCQSSKASNIRTSVLLDAAQSSTIHAFCMTRAAC